LKAHRAGKPPGDNDPPDINMNNMKNKLTETATSLGEGAEHVAEEMQHRAKDTWDSVRQQSNRAMRGSSAYVRENPVPTALAAFGVGLCLGLLLNRRDPASFNDHYVTEPLHQSKGVLLGLLIASGALLRRVFSSASSVVEEMAENAGDDIKESLKPVRRAARKARRTLGL
jgi:ElaB/YqjD/DUF883 family membrane-anchored ribosome-binding protein